MALDKVGEIIVTWIDFEGERRLDRFHFKYDDTKTVALIRSDAQALVTALEGITNISISHWAWLDPVFTTYKAPSTPTGQSYVNSEDGVLLQFADALGNRVRITPPAPLEADFGADLETVDPTATGVAAFIAAFTTPQTNLSVACSAAGGALTEFDLGYRKRGKSKKERPGYAKALG